MSATESLDDHDGPPAFDRRQWLRQLAAAIAAVAIAGAGLVCFRPTETRTEAQRQALLEILCSGQTLRPRADVEGCQPRQDSQPAPPARYSGSGRPDVAQALE